MILLTDNEIAIALEGMVDKYPAIHLFYDVMKQDADGGESLIRETIAKAQLKKVVDELDIRFIINMLKQGQEYIWQKRGRDICSKQIDKLEALLKETE